MSQQKKFPSFDVEGVESDSAGLGRSLKTSRMLAGCSSILLSLKRDPARLDLSAEWLVGQTDSKLEAQVLLNGLRGVHDVRFCRLKWFYRRLTVGGGTRSGTTCVVTCRPGTDEDLSRITPSAPDPV
jgi:hypothetical protein